jgi:hypothetical protein
VIGGCAKFGQDALKAGLYIGWLTHWPCDGCMGIVCGLKSWGRGGSGGRTLVLMLCGRAPFATGILDRLANDSCRPRGWI